MAAADAVAEGDLSARVPVPRRSPGEFGQLAESFNRMAGELERGGDLYAFFQDLKHLRTNLAETRRKLLDKQRRGEGLTAAEELTLKAYGNHDLTIEALMNRFRDLYANPKARLSSAEDLLADMDRADVAQAIVFGFGWRDHELCVQDNDYVMESVARYPERLIGFGIVNPAVGAEAIHEIEHQVEQAA